MKIQTPLNEHIANAKKFAESKTLIGSLLFQENQAKVHEAYNPLIKIDEI